MRKSASGTDCSTARRREIDLDVVRGIAILLAMGWHINNVSSTSRYLQVLLAPGSRIGWAGVDLFFVLSGFLIGGAIIREFQKTGSFDYSRFFVRRVFRLWPILYVFLTVMLILIPAKDFFWQAALHIQNFAPTKSAKHLWSLAVEEHFYLILGLGAPLVIKRWDWQKALPIILISTLIICPLLRISAWSNGAGADEIQIQTQYRLDAISAGALLSYFSAEKSYLFDRILRARTLLTMIAVSGTLFLWAVPKNTGLGEVVGFSVSWITSAAFLLTIYRSGIDRRFRKASLAIAFVGQVSYPLYLWHVPCIKLLEMLQSRLQFSNEVRVIATYVLSIAVAAFMTKLVERPVMRWRDRKFPAKVAAVDMRNSATSSAL